MVRQEASLRLAAFALPLALLLLLLHLLLALQFLEKLLGRLGRLLARILLLVVLLGGLLLVLTVVLIGSLLGRLRTIVIGLRCFRWWRCSTLNRWGHPRLKHSARDASAWTIPRRSRGCLRTTRFRSQGQTLNSGRIGRRTDDHVIEMRAVEQVGNNVAGSAGPKIRDYALSGAGRNVNVGAHLLFDGV